MRVRTRSHLLNIAALAQSIHASVYGQRVAFRHDARDFSQEKKPSVVEEGGSINGNDLEPETEARPEDAFEDDTGSVHTSAASNETVPTK
jgi:hypothetical protein